MIKRVDISTPLYIALMVLVFFVGATQVKAQEFINGDFEERIAKDIIAVEFWAEWNSTNQFNDLSNLKDCEVYRIDIMANADTQMEYNVSAIPTIIIFDNGIEKCRFNPNIMFQLEADKKILQHSVDTITLNKFQ